MKRRYAHLRPFSHAPGAACLIPGSSQIVQAFPSALHIYDLETNQLVKEIPVESAEFTLIQDLERGVVRCHGHAFTQKGKINEERLCLGVYKKQEVERIRRRLSLDEIFPLLFRLGNQVECPPTEERDSVFSLLESCRLVASPEEIAPAFRELFLAGFSPFMVPRGDDVERHNFYQPEAIATPILALLSETARWIRSLFFAAGDNSLHFLPKRPPEAVYGKMFALKTPFGLVDFEWSKKQMRKARFCCVKGGLLEIRLPSSIKSYRLRSGKKEWKVDSKTILEFEEKQEYNFDRFEK